MQSLIRGGLPTFLRLWLVLALAYVAAKIIFNLAFSALIDLRPVALAELILLPLVQSATFWLVTRRARRQPGSSA